MQTDPKYRDVILSMFVLRRLDCLLEGSKDAVMEEVQFQRENDFTELDPLMYPTTLETAYFGGIHDAHVDVITHQVPFSQ